MAALAALLVPWLAAARCGSRAPSLAELAEGDDCRRTVVVGELAEGLVSLEGDTARSGRAAELAVEWRLPSGDADRAELNAWCAAVGPAVMGGWGGAGADATPEGENGDGTRAARVDTFWVVTWNVHIGAGALRQLVADLRDGRLTSGEPVRHFAVLLQEAHRGGDLVPPEEIGEPGGSGEYAGPPGVPREDIVESAERLGLWMLYVPSMRNGATEDRGNAILSTLPLEDAAAVALPVARQRRVAVSARIRARTSAGRDWALQLASVHLESEPSGWRSPEEQRLEQAEALIEWLPEAELAVAGGDFNTRNRGREEATVWTMLRAYPSTPAFPAGPTYRKAFGLYREYLDYLFFRLPDRTPVRVRRAPRTYASDHYPLVGRIVW